MHGPKYTRAGAAIYRTPQWKAARHAAKTRDDWQCVKCGFKGRLEVDHIVAIRNGGAPYDLSNLQSLCAKCHGSKTRLEMGFPDKTPERKEWYELLKKPTPDF